MSASDINVVNAKVSELRKRGFRDLADFLSASKDHMYVGRSMPYVKGAEGSKWKNPFKLQDYGDDVDKVLSLYENHIKTGPLCSQLHELKGKTLACWCYPSPCHATVLKQLYEEQYPVSINEGPSQVSKERSIVELLRSGKPSG